MPLWLLRNIIYQSNYMCLKGTNSILFCPHCSELACDSTVTRSLKECVESFCYHCRLISFVFVSRNVVVFCPLRSLNLENLNWTDQRVIPRNYSKRYRRVHTTVENKEESTRWQVLIILALEWQRLLRGKDLLMFPFLSPFVQDIELSPSRVRTWEAKTMTASCSSAGRNASPCSGWRRASPVFSLCCRLACTRWMCRLETMATPRQGTVTVKDIFTLSDLTGNNTSVTYPLKGCW